MAQRYVQMGVFDMLPPTFHAIGNFLDRFLFAPKYGSSWLWPTLNTKGRKPE
jgi:hypothetical protein